MNVPFSPALGATVVNEGVRFRVWAPEAGVVAAILEPPGRPAIAYAMSPLLDGFFETVVPEADDGDLYRFRLDGRGPFPDPASRFQPLGVHGPSQVVDWHRFPWTDAGWAGLPLEETILYELHVGTFTPEGTFASATARLPDLSRLGVTAIELMPVADFAGRWNWGYDGVAPFAPARCYGTPDDLRRLVDAAHRLGLAVHLDVVYNHLGPDGAYQYTFSPHYRSRAHASPWGDAINFDGPGSRPVREYFVENALRWVHEYHLDGLRLDATHAIADESAQHIVASVAEAVQQAAAAAGRRVLVIAEDARNLAHTVKARPAGWGLDAIWSDDFHHQMRRLLAGDSDGYFADFDGTVEDVTRTARQGWYYCGQFASFFNGPRGTDPTGVPLSRFVFFLQNHDQVGNRAFGDRLHAAADLSSVRAATVLWLLLPETPLVFMGQEWAASTPFCYFTDHEPGLGALVTAGRRQEFSRFSTFSDPAGRETIPDPQGEATFRASQLDWSERERQPHASMLALYRRLLAIRRTEPAMLERSRESFGIEAVSADSVIIRRERTSGAALLAVVRLRGTGSEDLGVAPLAQTPAGSRWEVLLTTEDAGFVPEGRPAVVEASRPTVTFARPGAVVFKAAKVLAEGRD
jgi:maltooligosyltrehalose trehalohydrolase